MSFEKLPVELAESVLRQLNGKELCCARLVNHSWEKVATGILFRSVTLLSNERGLENWTNIMNSSRFVGMIRAVIINSWPITEHGPGKERKAETSSDWISLGIMMEWSSGDSSLLDTALESLVTVPNIERLRLQFSDQCAGAHERRPNYDIENTNDREWLLKRVTQVLADRQQRYPHADPLRAITIENLQNYPIDNLLDSESFKAGMRNIDQLHILVCEEYNEHAPEYDLELTERREFIPYLSQRLLVSFASQLTQLSLGFANPWGALPGRFKGQHLRFPRLKNLTLFQFCIAHRDSLDWVVAQTTLVSLVLRQCMIVRYAKLDDYYAREWNVLMDDWMRLSPEAAGLDDGTSELIFHYPGLWKDELRRITTELINLQYFCFFNDDLREDIPTDWDEVSPAEWLALSLSARHPHRIGGSWMAGGGYGYFELIIGCEEGQPEWGVDEGSECLVDPYEEYGKEDGEALRALIAATQARRKKS